MYEPNNNGKYYVVDKLHGKDGPKCLRASADYSLKRTVKLTKLNIFHICLVETVSIRLNSKWITLSHLTWKNHIFVATTC